MRICFLVLLQWPEGNLNWASHDKFLVQPRAHTHPFVEWHVVHGPLEAALRMSYDPIIRGQDVLTFNNPPQLGPDSVFSSLSIPPTHCILTCVGYQTKQGKIAFVLPPLCLCAGPTHQLVLSGEKSLISVPMRHLRPLWQGSLWTDPWTLSSGLETLTIQCCYTGLCANKACVF